MPRRKKTFDFNRLILAAVLIIGTWIAADYYFNVYRHPQTEPTPQKTDSSASVAAPVAETAVPAVPEVVSSDGFTIEAYRDDRYGIEFQYPVYGETDPLCPRIERTDNGFVVGIFSLAVTEFEGPLADFVAEQTQGLEIDKNENITVAGLASVKVDYQTKGMGWYGSDTYVAHAGKIYDFGILANATSDKCGGIDDYEDRVYQSVISTLKFNE